MFVLISSSLFGKWRFENEFEMNTVCFTRQKQYIYMFKYMQEKERKKKPPSSFVCHGNRDRKIRKVWEWMVCDELDGLISCLDSVSAPPVLRYRHTAHYVFHANHHSMATKIKYQNKFYWNNLVNVNSIYHITNSQICARNEISREKKCKIWYQSHIIGYKFVRDHRCCLTQFNAS